MLTNVRQIFWKTEGVNTARCLFLLVVVGVLLVLVFHFILLSNLTLILYSLFLPKLTWIALKVMIHPSPLTNHSTRVTNATPITSYKKGPLGWQVVKRAYSPCQATAHSAPALRGPCSYSVRVGHFDSNDNWTFSWPTSI